MRFIGGMSIRGWMGGFLLLSYDTTGLRNRKRSSGLWVSTRHLVRCMVFSMA